MVHPQLFLDPCFLFSPDDHPGKRENTCDDRIHHVGTMKTYPHRQCPAIGRDRESTIATSKMCRGKKTMQHVIPLWRKHEEKLGTRLPSQCHRCVIFILSATRCNEANVTSSDIRTVQRNPLPLNTHSATHRQFQTGADETRTGYSIMKFEERHLLPNCSRDVQTSIESMRKRHVPRGTPRIKNGISRPRT